MQWELELGSDGSGLPTGLTLGGILKDEQEPDKGMEGRD